MRVLVFRTGSLFAHDETGLYANRLCSAISALGHPVELAMIPFSGSVADLVPEITAYRLLDLRHGGDRCIVLGPFAHALAHSDRRVWAFAQYDPFNGLWGTDFGAVTASHTNAILRNYVHALDRAWLAKARQVRAASQMLSNALSAVIGQQVRLLRPAIVEELVPTRSDPSACFLLATRLSDRSRLAMVIAALEDMTTPARLLILGCEESLEEREFVEQRIAASPKRAAIQLEINPAATRFREAAGSAAALIVSAFRCGMADAYMLGAASAAVPVITTTDAGEPALLVEDGVSGYVVEPQPAALAQVMSQVLRDPPSAERRARAMAARLAKLLPGWDSIASELTR